MPARISLVVTSLCMVGAAALATAPGAAAGDGETDRGGCRGDSTSSYRLRVSADGNGRLTVVGSVFSEDDDVWEWRMRHNDDFSAKGEVRAKDADRSFRISRSMIDLGGADDIEFRAENTANGVICKGEVIF
ncbi:hypothetical protein [Nocardioides sp. Leaf374]|uniref:hypothetical protein n=1 Tax=Nocardioides sp. Leaf374 TaxID=2876560 RepID=UPI001E4A86C0|nr:hypothetical protein [Nocardioides sp. Leaf374]